MCALDVLSPQFILPLSPPSARYPLQWRTHVSYSRTSVISRCRCPPHPGALVTPVRRPGSPHCPLQSREQPPCVWRGTWRAAHRSGAQKANSAALWGGGHELDQQRAGKGIIILSSEALEDGSHDSYCSESELSSAVGM